MCCVEQARHQPLLVVSIIQVTRGITGMYQLTTHGKITLMVGALLYPIIWIFCIPNTFDFWRPIPLLMLFGPPSFLLILLSGPILWMWNAEAFEGGTAIPLRSTVLFVITATLSLINGITGIMSGIEYHGKLHTVTGLVISAVCLATLIIIRIWAWRKSSFTLNITFHWLLFAWVLTYAFPYLGELP